MRMRTSNPFATPPVVLNLMIINILVFLAQSVLPYAQQEWIIENLSLFFWQSPYFKPHQLVTHMFLHANLTHIFMNMFALWMFGRTLEYDLGSKRFLTYYMICGVGAALFNLGVTWIEIANLQHAAGATHEIMSRINTPMLGASGAIFGVLLAFGMMHPNALIILLIPPIPIKAKYFVIGYGLLELFLGVSGMEAGVAHFAHVGGMVFGFFLLRHWRKTGKIYY